LSRDKALTCSATLLGFQFRIVLYWNESCVIKVNVCKYVENQFPLPWFGIPAKLQNSLLAIEGIGVLVTGSPTSETTILKIDRG
jgi:hypothetical protein